MDAVNYLNEKQRMCNIMGGCADCPMTRLTRDGSRQMSCVEAMYRNPDESVKIVEQWSKDHPIKTRQSELMKIFPNIPLNQDGIISHCPRAFDTTSSPDYCKYKTTVSHLCADCKKMFWLTEIK